jgi:hypothetical protein
MPDAAPEGCLAVPEGPRTLSRTRECGEFRRDLGVYVVGAIGGAERRTVDDHLASCADCREELAGLAGLPGLLAKWRAWFAREATVRTNCCQM